MAAISTAITVLRHKKDKYRRDNTHTLQLDMFGGYFETLALLDLLGSSDLNCHSFQDEPPIVVMEFYMAEDSGENHDFLLAVTTHEVRQRKLVFQKGASFGFPFKTSTGNLPSFY